VLDALMREEDLRVICGDTTAEIAARMLGAELVMEPPPQEGWLSSSVSRMILPDGAQPVAMVTEGVVTMRVARDRWPSQASRDLAGRADGASRLAHVLMTADRGGSWSAWRSTRPGESGWEATQARVVEALVDDLKACGKIVSVERF